MNHAGKNAINKKYKELLDRCTTGIEQNKVRDEWRAALLADSLGQERCQNLREKARNLKRLAKESK